MKKSYRGILINEAFLNSLPVKQILDEEGCTGLGLLVLTLFELKRRYHAVGRFDDMEMVASTGRKNTAKCIEWIKKHDIFTVNEEDKLFTYNNFRKIFGLEHDITDIEREVIKVFGNMITSEPEGFIEKYKAEHPDEYNDDDDDEECGENSTADDENNAAEEAENTPENARNKARKDAEKTESLKNFSTNDERSLNDRSKTFKKLSSQPTDTQADAEPLYNSNSIGIGIHPIGKNNTIPKHHTADADDESSFKFFEKKIFNDKKWRRATSISHGIDLTSDDVMHTFTWWMYEYCISKNKKVRTPQQIKYFASNLLTQDHKTRLMFDKYLESQQLQKETERQQQREAERQQHTEAEHREPEHPNSGSFETIRNGHRYGLGGQPLPDDAPVQTDIDWRWSYRMHRYVDKSQFDKDAEMAVWNQQQQNSKARKAARIRAAVEACNARLEREEQERRSRNHDLTSNIRSVGDIINDKFLAGLGKAYSKK